MSEWISVKERLPEIGPRVQSLVFVVDYENDYTYQIVSCRWETGFANTMRGQKVTHWMPLPAPPEAQGEDSQ